MKFKSVGKRYPGSPPRSLHNRLSSIRVHDWLCDVSILIRHVDNDIVGRFKTRMCDNSMMIRLHPGCEGIGARDRNYCYDVKDLPSTQQLSTPSNYPSMSATDSPFSQPSSPPSIRPTTAAPTTSPSSKPNIAPSLSPSLEPTSVPSNAPSSLPTLPPSDLLARVNNRLTNQAFIRHCSRIANQVPARRQTRVNSRVANQKTLCLCK
jgi:hypothetical protein